MKRTLAAAALLAALAAALPFLCLLPVFPAPATAVPQATPAAGAGEPPATPAPTATPSPEVEEAGELIRLYDAATGAVREVAVRDYLIGAAACEMPADWPDHALMAQMVASHSWALYQHSQGGASQGGDLAVNSAQCSGWTTAEVLQSRWGDAYAENLARFGALADQVLDAVLLYGATPAAACYHAASAGHTEASQNVWLEALPYLQGVDSAWDAAEQDYEVTIQYTAQQMADALAQNLGLTPQGDPSGWVGGTVWDDAGYVQSIALGGQSFSGTAVRAALSLRSACFAIAWQDGLFFITTRGYGHGVGLSQCGARSMAAGGATWREILLYYFPGTTVQG